MASINGKKRHLSNGKTDVDLLAVASKEEDLSMHLFLIVALGLAILTVIFALQNTSPVVVTFLVWKFEGSLAMVLMLTFALGVIVSSLVSIPAIIRRRSVSSHQSKKIAELESEARESMPPSQ